MAIATSGESRTAGPFESLKELGRTAVGILRTRLDLLVTEITEEQSRVVELLLYAVVALLCLFLAVGILAAFVVASLWDTPYRVFATGAMIAVLVAAGVACAITFVKKAKARPRLFSTSLDELSADLERLE